MQLFFNYIDTTRVDNVVIHRKKNIHIGGMDVGGQGVAKQKGCPVGDGAALRIRE